MLARIKPYNPKLGQVARRYMTRGRRYEEAKGWYEVSDEDATYLQGITREVPKIVHPVHIFDVMAKEEAAKVDADENRTDDLRATADSPNVDESAGSDAEDEPTSPGSDLTTSDLKSGTAPAKKRGRPKKT